MKNRLISKRILSILLFIVFVHIMFIHTTIIVTASATEQEDNLEAIESAEAAAMQLMKTEGDVTVSNAGGRNISIIKNMRLYNGYHTNTDEASYAWINLDDEKLIKQDAVSETEIRKSGKKLEILLKSGNLFFDVTEPLEEEETLNIRTSTMVVGIRGTSGWVKVLDRWRSRVCVLEGTVTCCVTDPVTGQTKSTTLSGGEMAEFVVYEEDQNGERCDILKDGFSEDEIEGFVLVELAGNDALCRKIKDASGLDAGSASVRAGERLAADEARMKETMDAIREQYENQENHISRDPVWIEGTDLPETEEGGNSTGRIRNPGRPGTQGGTGASGNGNSSGGGGSSSANTAPGSNEDVNTPPPVTLTDGTDPIDVQSLQKLLNSTDVGEVVVNKNPNPPMQSVEMGTDTGIFVDVPIPTKVVVDSDITIPTGKTLTLGVEVDMVVEEGNTLTIDGTLNIDTPLINNGTIIVTSSD
ncbi:hypothetical protein D5278_03795 [bacterium 1XD21-13]|nr:hypothetical protein [bacterium 1XD21-13]